MDLHLTTGERVLLANQYRILEALYPDEADSYARYREAVESGYTLHYDDGAGAIYEEMSREECREVLDILQMFDSMQFAYRQLQDKTGIEERTIEFPGFDGNNEVAQLGYTEYFIERLDRYDGLKSADGYNSHMPTLNMYRRMLEVWRPLQMNQLTKMQIQSIVAERTHPDNR